MSDKPPICPDDTNHISHPKGSNREGVCVKCGRRIPDYGARSSDEVEARKNKLRCYVAGAMSGIPEHNFPAFRKAAEILRSLGHEVTSPVEMDEADGFDEKTAADTTPGSKQWATFLARDVMVVADPALDAVVVIDGWENSRGAALEVHVARELGKPILQLDGTGRLVPVKAPTKYQPPSDETVLDTAARLVDGDRGEAYGEPVDDFARTAGIATALGIPLRPEQVPLLMIAVKLSRLAETPTKRDSVVDIAGYALTYEYAMRSLGKALR